jgi:hypothetical protein
LINYSTKVGMTIYNEGCKKLTTEFDMKSSGTVVYTTELQAKCIKMGWHMGNRPSLIIHYQHSFLPHRSGIAHLPCLRGTV